MGCNRQMPSGVVDWRDRVVRMGGMKEVEGMKAKAAVRERKEHKRVGKQ